MGTATVVGIAPAFPTNTSLTTTPVMVTVALLSFPAGKLRLREVKSLAQGSGTQQSLALCTCDINQCPPRPPPHCHTLSGSCAWALWFPPKEELILVLPRSCLSFSVPGDNLEAIHVCISKTSVPIRPASTTPACSLCLEGGLILISRLIPSTHRCC